MGFLEHVKQVGKIIEKFEEALPELEEFQGNMSEKRDQLEKLKVRSCTFFFLSIKNYNFIENKIKNNA